MTNQEMLNAYNGLKLFQEKEAQIYKEDGKKILSGKIKLSYAINKNTNLLLNALKPYEDTRKELMEEYRDRSFCYKILFAGRNHRRWSCAESQWGKKEKKTECRCCCSLRMYRKGKKKSTRFRKNNRRNMWEFCLFAAAGIISEIGLYASADR